MGAWFTSLNSTEDHGWVSPVMARESALRSSLNIRSAVKSQPDLSPLGSKDPSFSPLLLPLDVNARALLGHVSHQAAAMPWTWALGLTALESEIEKANVDT